MVREPKPGRRSPLRALMLVTIAAAVVAAFTASPAFAVDEIDFSTLQCQKKGPDGNLTAFGSGDTGNDKNYRELEYVTCRFQLSSSVAGANGELSIQFGSTNSSCVPFDPEFRLLSTGEGGYAGPILTTPRGDGSETYESAVSVTTDGGVYDAGGPGDFYAQDLNIDFLANQSGPTFVYFQLRFSDFAAECSGSTIHIQGVPVTNVKGGSEDVPFPTVESNAVSAVTMSSMGASRVGKAVVVRWRTGSESRTLGFKVFRVKAGKRVAVSKVIAAASLTGRSGRTYSFLDRRAPKGKAVYWIQELGTNGKNRWYGPVRAGAASA